MRKILEEFFQGDLRPCDKVMVAGSALRRAVARVSSCEEKLRDRLNDEERQLLQALTAAQLEANYITAQENFIMGFRLGIRMLMECMDDADGDITD